jgi:endoglucanase
MYALGATRAPNEFYHLWYMDGSPRWDRVGVSEFGPAPGFLVGGPNPNYDRADCCPNSCETPEVNAACDSESIVPPKDQPILKSYKDFNTSWPINSWEVTENHNEYQAAYLRLLSNFVGQKDK